MGGQLLVFPSPLGLSFYKEKNTEFICVLRVMDSLLLLLGECTQTLWKRSVPAQLCPPLSLLIPPQQHPPLPSSLLLLYFSPDLQGPFKPHPKPPPSRDNPSCCGTVTHTDGGRFTDFSHIGERGRKCLYNLKSEDILETLGL